MFLILRAPDSPIRGEAPPGGDPRAVLEDVLGGIGEDAPGLAVRLPDLLAVPVARNELDALALERMAEGEPLAALVLERCLAALAARRLLAYASAADPNDALVQLRPVVPAPLPVPTRDAPSEPVRLSRFALVRLEEGQAPPGTTRPGADLVVESPLSAFRWHLPSGSRSGTAGRLLSLLAEGAGEAELARARLPAPQRGAALALLRMAGLVLPLDADGLSEEDCDPVRRQWEPHDMWFHSRSRVGTHDRPIGGDFRFKGDLPPQPAVPPPPPHFTVIPLPRPAPEALAADPPLAAVVERRRTVRPAASRPLALAEVGAFLWRTARIVRRFQTELGEFTSRPYPSGGGSYETELYLTVACIADLAPGFYAYDAERHALLLLRPWDADCEEMRRQAILAMAGTTVPDVVLTLGARFQRVSWKYSGMAYATQLKNAGAQLMAFYLAATAMGLSPCGMGLGSTVLFARLSGRPPLEQGAVAEFALSGPPA